MKRVAKIIGGIEYDFSHLKPMVVPVTSKAIGAPTYHVLFSFGSHTFTKAWEPCQDPAQLFSEDGESAVFVPTGTLNLCFSRSCSVKLSRAARISQIDVIICFWKT
jgi:hypothetical protein